MPLFTNFYCKFCRISTEYHWEKLNCIFTAAPHVAGKLLDLKRHYSILAAKPGTVRARSHYAICNCDLLFLTMGCIGAGDAVAVAQCEHFHWDPYNPFVAIRWIAVAIRKKTHCEWTVNVRSQNTHVFHCFYWNYSCITFNNVVFMHRQFIILVGSERHVWHWAWVMVPYPSLCQSDERC